MDYKEFFNGVGGDGEGEESFSLSNKLINFKNEREQKEFSRVIKPQGKKSLITNIITDKKEK